MVCGLCGKTYFSIMGKVGGFSCKIKACGVLISGICGCLLRVDTCNGGCVEA